MVRTLFVLAECLIFARVEIRLRGSEAYYRIVWYTLVQHSFSRFNTIGTHLGAKFTLPNAAICHCQRVRGTETTRASSKRRNDPATTSRCIIHRGGPLNAPSPPPLPADPAVLADGPETRRVLIGAAAALRFKRAACRERDRRVVAKRFSPGVSVRARHATRLLSSVFISGVTGVTLFPLPPPPEEKCIPPRNF